MIILDEKQHAQDVYFGKTREKHSLIEELGYIVRFQCLVLHYNDEQNYNYAVKWLYKNRQSFDESIYSKLVSDAIEKTSRIPFYNLNSIKITKNEVQKIKQIGDIRKEKILFVLLCMAKYEAVIYGYSDGLVRYNISDVFKQARISIKVSEREYLLHEMVVDKLIGYPKKNASQCLFINIIDKDDQDIAFELNQADCLELAYSYLYYVYQDNFIRCLNCGKLLRKRGNKKLCPYCSDYQPVNSKLITCVDCGIQFLVSSMDNNTTRCTECYSKYRKEQVKKNVKKFRQKIV